MMKEESQGALAGLKILDFSTLLPGPYASMTLADLGAEVIRVSAPGRRDAVETYPPEIDGEGVTSSLAWLGRNKRTITLNLKRPEAVAMVKKMIMTYDIILEQFRPGVMARLGLDYETLKTINPRLIYCSLTGYGQTGPYRDKAGHDINYLALSGNLGQAGRRDAGPAPTNMQLGDVASGAMNAVVGILAAVYHRERTGQGQQIDIAMLDGLIPFNGMDATAFLATGKSVEREGSWLNGGSLYDFYETADGYLSVGAIEPKFWKTFCEGIGCPELIEGGIYPEQVAAAKAKIRNVLAQKTTDQWMAVFGDTDACVAPVLSMARAFNDDPQIAERGMIVDVPLAQGSVVKQPANPIKLSETPPRYNHGGYPTGHDTQSVLSEFGFSEDEILKVQRP